MEVWKDIPNYEGHYQISNFGRMKSLERHIFFGRNKKVKKIIKEKILKTTTNKDGYQYFTISKNNIRKKIKVHRAIAISFIPNPNNYSDINHINAIRNDNRIENLEWCNHSHNMKHKFIMGNQSNALGNNSMARKVIDIKTGMVFDSIKEASIFLNVNYRTLACKLSGHDNNNTNIQYL